MCSDVAVAAGNVAYDIFDTNMWGGTVPQSIFVRLRPPALIYRCFAPSEFPHLYHWSLYSYVSAREVFETTHTL